MNLRMITKDLAADPEIIFSQNEFQSRMAAQQPCRELSLDFSKLGQGSFAHSFPNFGRFRTISRVLIIIK